MDLAKAPATICQAATRAVVRGSRVLSWLLINTPVRMLMSVLTIMQVVPMLALIHLDVLSAYVLQASCWALIGRHVMVREVAI